eukprot:5237065-Lingulodinium_polyedra.AAC.1
MPANAVMPEYAVCRTEFPVCDNDGEAVPGEALRVEYAGSNPVPCYLAARPSAPSPSRSSASEAR